MENIINSIQSIQATNVYDYIYAIGAHLGAYSGLVYFVLAVLAIYVIINVAKVAIKVLMVALILYCGSGILLEYLPRLEHIFGIFR